MRMILLASTVAALVGLSGSARAQESRPGLLERGREVVQAGFHKCREKRRGPCVSSCNPCGADDVRIGQLIDTLLCGERACDRRRAADALEKYNWTQHPEIVSSLTYAMQSDPVPAVRWNAADALKDMKVSEPDAIGAMQFTRSEDPSCRTRYKAKWGIIEGERSQPPCLTYVSGYGPAKSEDEESPRATPRLQPTPAPKQILTPEPLKPENSETGGSQTKGHVRSFISNAMSKVRSRS